MDGKKKFEARHLTPQRYLFPLSVSHTHTHTYRSCLETTGYNHTCQVKSVFNLALDVRMFRPRPVAFVKHYIMYLVYCSFSEGTSQHFNLSTAHVWSGVTYHCWWDHRTIALHRSECHDPSRSNPTMQCWPGAWHDFHHNAASIRWFHVWWYCVWQTWTQTWTLSSFQVNLILSSDHLMREFLIQLASESSLSDEHWQRLIFKPGDGVSHQYFP